MTSADLQQVFRKKVCEEIDVEHEGIDRYVIYTPFMFDDGDHYVVVLKRQNRNWMLTDEGHTFMHLSYADLDIEHGTRKSIIDQALLSFNLTNQSGELRLEVPGEQFGDALLSSSSSDEG
jgi:hypothetical protein